MILEIIIGIFIFLVVTGGIFHATYFRNKKNAITPYGKMIDVNGGKMHIYSMGTGKKTIVLLPGMGVGLPAADFSPLMRKLSQKYTVVAVEYFGVGFSNITTKPRTTNNYVEEIREALNKSGLRAPYILMPHSISSIYSEYYASKYEDEVEAVISLDGTSSAFYQKMPSFVKFILPVAKLMQSTGLTSFLAEMTTNKRKLLSYGYTKKEINDSITFAGFSMNSNLLEQIAGSSEYVKDTMDLPFPKNIPYFKVIARKTYETPNKQLKMTPQEYQHQHLERIGDHAEYVVLEGNHFIYLNNTDKIVEITDKVAG